MPICGLPTVRVRVRNRFWLGDWVRVRVRLRLESRDRVKVRVGVQLGSSLFAACHRQWSPAAPEMRC